MIYNKDMATTHALKNPTKKKKKKKHIGLRIFLILIIVILVVPLIFVSTVLITWKSGKDISNVKDANINEIVEDKLFEAINDVPNTKQITIQFKEDDLNALLKNATKQIGQPDYIPQIYCSVNGNNYDFGVDVQWKFIKTNIILQTTLTSDSTKDDLLFKINRIKLGYCPLPDFLYKIIVDKFDLNKVFKGFGLNFEFNLANKEIRYPRTAFINDITNLINKQSNADTNLISLVMSLIKKNELFDPIFNGGFGATIYLNNEKDNDKFNLSKVHFNGYSKPQDQDPFSLDDIRDKVSKIMNNSKNSDLKSTDVETLFKYIAYGDYNSYKTVVDKVKSWDGTGIDKTTYKGTKYIEDVNNKESSDTTNFYGQIKTGIDNIRNNYISDITSHLQDKEIYIDASSIEGAILRQFCANKKVVGFVKPIIRKKDNQYEISYIGIRDFDFQMVNGKLYAVASLSINGYDIYLTIETSVENSNNNLFIKFEKIYFGKINIDEMGDPNLKNTILSLIKNSVDQTSKLFSLDDKGVIIHVQEAIKEMIDKTQDQSTKKQYEIIRDILYKQDGASIEVQIGTQQVKINGIKGTFAYNIATPQGKTKEALNFKTHIIWQ